MVLHINTGWIEDGADIEGPCTKDTFWHEEIATDFKLQVSFWLNPCIVTSEAWTSQEMPWLLQNPTKINVIGRFPESDIELQAASFEVFTNNGK